MLSDGVGVGSRRSGKLCTAHACGVPAKGGGPGCLSTHSHHHRVTAFRGTSSSCCSAEVTQLVGGRPIAEPGQCLTRRCS